MTKYSYKYKEVLEEEYVVFLRLLDMTEYHKADYILTELKINENHLLLKSKKTADKYKDIFDSCNKKLKEVVRVEYSQEQIDKNTNMFVNFLRAKGGVRR